MQILGPWEPEGFTALRDEYWRSTLHQANLEARIGLTDMGLDWLMRVRRIGHRTLETA